MTRARLSTGTPSDVDVALLRVCFAPFAEATRIWDEQLAGALAIEELDTEAHGLFPLLHRRLLELNRRPPSLAKLHGVRRRLWVTNGLQMRAAGRAVVALERAGVASVLFGPAAVLVGHLGSVDLRPLPAVDLFVPAGADAVATEVLAAGGWALGSRWRGGFLLDIAVTRFSDGAGQSLLVQSASSGAYDGAFPRRRVATLGQDFLPVAGPADLLLHILLDGERLLPGARVRWLADAFVVAGEHGDGVDWEVVAVAAEARKGRRAVADALRQMRDIVPLEALTGLPASLSLSSVPGLPLRPGVRRPALLTAYARRIEGMGLRSAICGIPGYLREVCEVESMSRLPSELARRARRRTVTHRDPR